MKLLRVFGVFTFGLVVALMLPACKRDPDSLTVAFISNNPHEFWTIARSGTEQAARDFDINVEFYMPAYGTAAEQHRIIEDLIAKGVKGIAISPNDAANQSGVLNQIIPDSVAFITQDSDLLPSSKRLCYIGTDNIEAGRAVGMLVKEACAKAFPDKDTINIVIYVGMLDVQNAKERRQGVIASLAGVSNDEAKELAEGSYPTERLGGKYVILRTMTDEASMDKCKRNVEDTLSERKDVHCLIGLWAYNPPAMVQAVRDAGRLGQVQMVGFDEDEETLNAIKQGWVYATVVQHPYMFGYLSTYILQHKIREGKLPDQEQVQEQLKDGTKVELDKTNYYVRHRVIKRKDHLGPGKMAGIEVERFHAELKKLKG
jgi:ribose transport system substrate-binding protein